MREVELVSKIDVKLGRRYIGVYYIYLLTVFKCLFSMCLNRFFI